MSCWIVSPTHIDVIVSGLVAKGIIRKAEIGRVRNGLVCENVESYTYRYAHIPEAMAEAAAFDREQSEAAWTEYETSDGVLAAAAECYRYQACEHPEWENSEAHTLTLALREACPGRAADVWGIEERHVGTIVRRPVVMRAPWVRPLTRAQREGLLAVYNRTPLVRGHSKSQTGHSYPCALRADHYKDRRPMTYREFRKMCHWPSYDALMVPWLGMWLGIEPDGYTHS